MTSRGGQLIGWLEVGRSHMFSGLLYPRTVRLENHANCGNDIREYTVSSERESHACILLSRIKGQHA